MRRLEKSIAANAPERYRGAYKAESLAWNGYVDLIQASMGRCMCLARKRVARNVSR